MTIHTAMATASGSGRDAHAFTDDSLADGRLDTPDETGRGATANRGSLPAGGHAASAPSASLFTARNEGQNDHER